MTCTRVIWGEVKANAERDQVEKPDVTQRRVRLFSSNAEHDDIYGFEMYRIGRTSTVVSRHVRSYVLRTFTKLKIGELRKLLELNTKEQRQKGSRGIPEYGWRLLCEEAPKG